MEGETKTDMYTCLDIRFSNSRKTYSYISDDPTIERGDFVLVPARWCDTVVEVVNVGSYEEKDLLLPVNKMKYIKGIYRKRQISIMSSRCCLKGRAQQNPPVFLLTK